MKKRLLRLLAFLTMSAFCINNVGNVQATSPIPKPDKTIAVSGVSLTPNNRVMKIGDTLDLFLTINPSNATNKSVTWSTTNKNVATVTSTGRVTAVGYGNAIIVVRSSNGRSANSYITVKNGSSEEVTTTEVRTTDTIVPQPTTETRTTEATTEKKASTANIGNNSVYYMTENVAEVNWSAVNGQQAKEDIQTSVSDKTVAKGTKLIKSKLVYKVMNVNQKTVSCVKAQGTTKTTIVIPATIKYKGVLYKVNAIEDYAFKNNKKVNKVVIGKNVKEIGEQAFYGCKNLKTITIKSKKLNKVGTKAFNKTGKKLVVKVPNGKMKKYQKLLGR